MGHIYEAASLVRGHRLVEAAARHTKFCRGNAERRHTECGLQTDSSSQGREPTQTNDGRLADRPCQLQCCGGRSLLITRVCDLPPSSRGPESPRSLPTGKRPSDRRGPRDEPEAAMCVRNVDDQCVLQFTLVHAAGCVLHRRTSRVIHR